MRDLRDALKPESLPLRGSVDAEASKLLSLGFHTGDPITTTDEVFDLSLTLCSFEFFNLVTYFVL